MTTIGKQKVRSSVHPETAIVEGRTGLIVTLTIATMKRKFHVGDKIRVIGLRIVMYPPGVKDEMGNEKLFASMLAKVQTVKGFDQYGTWN